MRVLRFLCLGPASVLPTCWLAEQRFIIVNDAVL